MKFNAIVGNPPYQITVGKENKNYALIIYDKFMKFSKISILNIFLLYMSQDGLQEGEV